MKLTPDQIQMLAQTLTIDELGDNDDWKAMVKQIQASAENKSGPGNPETLELPCTLKLTFDPSRTRNSIHLTYPDVGFEIIDTGAGGKIGEVNGCLGGAMEFRLGGLTYTLDTRALWRAMRDALTLEVIP